MTKFFKKCKKKPFLGKTKFPQNVLGFSILNKYHDAKLKKTKERIPSNTGFRRTDTWTDNHEFIGSLRLKPGV